ncbi:transposase [Streptomyces sp. NPDC059070]|uniref:transposase n=1 Tax=unclassified Streptomyces TaxID=2593676 RepID=UPI0034E1E357
MSPDIGRRFQCTNPLKRVNREIKRRVDVVRSFLRSPTLEGLATAVLIELHDEWIAFPRSYLPNGGMDSISLTQKINPTPLHHCRGHDRRTRLSPPIEDGG